MNPVICPTEPPTTISTPFIEMPQRALASPSMTTSASRTDTATEHRGSRATLRPFRVPAPVWNQNVPSSHRAPTAVTCGLPSSLTVASQVVREFSASGAGADPASSFATTAAQSTGGSPSA